MIIPNIWKKNVPNHQPDESNWVNSASLRSLGSWGFRTCIGAEPAEGGQHGGGAHQEGQGIGCRGDQDLRIQDILQKWRGWAVVGLCWVYFLCFLWWKKWDIQSSSQKKISKAGKFWGRFDSVSPRRCHRCAQSWRWAQAHWGCRPAGFWCAVATPKKIRKVVQ